MNIPINLSDFTINGVNLSTKRVIKVLYNGGSVVYPWRFYDNCGSLDFNPILPSFKVYGLKNAGDMKSDIDLLKKEYERLNNEIIPSFEKCIGLIDDNIMYNDDFEDLPESQMVVYLKDYFLLGIPEHFIGGDIFKNLQTLYNSANLFSDNWNVNLLDNNPVDYNKFLEVKGAVLSFFDNNLLFDPGYDILFDFIETFLYKPNKERIADYVEEFGNILHTFSVNIASTYDAIYELSENKKQFAASIGVEIEGLSNVYKIIENINILNESIPNIRKNRYPIFKINSLKSELESLESERQDLSDWLENHKDDFINSRISAYIAPIETKLKNCYESYTNLTPKDLDSLFYIMSKYESMRTFDNLRGLSESKDTLKVMRNAVIKDEQSFYNDFSRLLRNKLNSKNNNKSNRIEQEIKEFVSGFPELREYHDTISKIREQEKEELEIIFFDLIGVSEVYNRMKENHDELSERHLDIANLIKTNENKLLKNDLSLLKKQVYTAQETMGTYGIKTTAFFPGPAGMTLRSIDELSAILNN